MWSWKEFETYIYNLYTAYEGYKIKFFNKKIMVRINNIEIVLKYKVYYDTGFIKCIISNNCSDDFDIVRFICDVDVEYSKESFENITMLINKIIK